MKWKLFDHLVVCIVNETFKGIGDTDNVIGCVGVDQRHVAEHIVNAYNNCESEIEQINNHLKAAGVVGNSSALQGVSFLCRLLDQTQKEVLSVRRRISELLSYVKPESQPTHSTEVQIRTDGESIQGSEQQGEGAGNGI